MGLRSNGINIFYKSNLSISDGWSFMSNKGPLATIAINMGEAIKKLSAVPIKFQGS